MKFFPKLLNVLICYLQNHEVLGKYRLYMMCKSKFGHYVIKHKIGFCNFVVPFDQWCFWKNYGPNNYYLEETLPFFELINRELDEFDFVDLGADIGVVSILAQKYCTKLNQTIAFEPNPKTYEILYQNALYSQKKYVALNKAISDFNGTCHLNFQHDVSSDHEGFIDVERPGDTQIVTLDSLYETLGLLEQVVLKIDVEGQEQAVLRGAKNTLTKCKKVIIFIELHPDTLKRHDLTPEDIFLEAENVRKFKWLVPLLGNKEVCREDDFFSQFPLQQYDVIGIAI